MTNTYTDTAKQLIINDITDVDISTVTFNTDELYLAPDNAVYSVNNITPVNGNVTLDIANKDLSNLSSTGNAKFQAPITGGASTITSSNLTANKALISNASGKVAVSSVTSSELGYLLGVTSNVQTQLNGKQATLVSGTNIKTINSISLLGSGNIAVGTVTSVNNVSPVNGNVTISIPAEVTESTVSGWGFTKNTGTVTSVNNVSPVNGNVTLSIPDTTNLANKNLSNLSTTGEKHFLKNIATGSDALTIIGTATTQQSGINIGSSSNVTGLAGVALGVVTEAGAHSTAIGGGARATGEQSIQIGSGTNSTNNSMSIGFYDANHPSEPITYQLLDGTTGLIPDARISSNIARTSAIPNEISDLTDDTATYPIDQADALTNQRSGGNAIKSWTGTKAQYDAITTKDANTLYNITDDIDVTLTLLNAIYPVGSIYIGTMATCPLATLGIGTWQLVATDRVLQGAGTRGAVGSTVNESLPNITGNSGLAQAAGSPSGAFYTGSSLYTSAYSPSSNYTTVALNASRSSSTYQDNAPVQQDAYLVNIWERVA